METEATFNACMMEPQCTRYTGFKSDGACVENTMPSVIEAFSKQISSENSKIVDTVDVDIVTRIYLQ